MTKSNSERSDDTIHVLHLAYDDDDCAALTILANDVRFHIVANPKNLQIANDKTLYYEFLDRLYALRDAEQWESNNTREEKSSSAGQKRSARSGIDSAVDVTADEAAQDHAQDSLSAEEDLRQMLLRSMTEVISTFAPSNRPPQPSSVYEWYHGPTYFYSLGVQNGVLVAELLEGSGELTECIDKLVPRMKMPRYIQNIDVAWVDSRDLMVDSEVDFPEPAHPGKVTDKEGRIFFFKPVVPHQPGPTKREISLLQKIEKLELNIKVPKLMGFVSYEKSQCEAMGFLLSPIEEPTPLTNLLKNAVPKGKRDAWSVKSEQYVKTLHDNNIVWGDAKADNFIVDKNDDLWIIDFGGSYTEGWVDPEISETVEGDDQGLQRVQEALHHPEDEPQSHGSHALKPSQTKEETGSWLFVTEGHKRKHNDKEEDQLSFDESQAPTMKRRCEGD